MHASKPASKQFHFGVFEVDLRARELRKSGLRVKLQGLPFKILVLLLEHPGEVVTREELRQALWPADTFVDFEHGLNTAIMKLRSALGDDAQNPRFVETLAQRGYRFLATASRGGPASPPAATGETAAAAPPPFPAPRSPIRAIVVLPLQNLSRDPGQDYFSDGMTEALTTHLSKISALKVISRTSANHYKGTQKALPEIAQELGVDAVVEGSVLRQGDRVRITVQLIDAASDRHLWAEAYDRDLRDVMALQTEVVRAIIQEVRVKLTLQEEARIEAGPAMNPRALEAFLRGRYHLERWSPEDAKRAAEYFLLASQEDPNSALPHAGLAETYISFGITETYVGGGLAKAKAEAEKALELDSGLGEAHAALGMCKHYHERDFAGAEREFKRAIELNPGYGPSYHWYSHFLLDLGRFPESLAESRRWVELDPLSPAAQLHLGYHYLVARQYDLAIEQNARAVAMDPNYIEAHRQLGQAYLGKGTYKPALLELEKANQLSGARPGYVAWLAHGYALAGRRAEALRLLDDLLAGGKTKAGTTPIALAWIHAGLKQNDLAFGQLEKAYQEHDGDLLSLNVNLEYDNLRSDPRFQDLLRRMKLLR